jgi:hypothetical protein
MTAMGQKTDSESVASKRAATHARRIMNGQRKNNISHLKTNCDTSEISKTRVAMPWTYYTPETSDGPTPAAAKEACMQRLLQGYLPIVRLNFH